MDLGDTSFISALRESARLFKAGKGASKSQDVIIIFTDGEPDDPRKLSKEAYFREIQDFVAKELADSVLYVIAVDVKGSYWPKDRPYWERITRGNTFLINSMNEKNLDKVFTNILLKLLKTPEITWDSIPPEGLKVKIEPYLERLTFSFLKENPGVKVTILRENGQPLTRETPGVNHLTGRVSEIYSIADPEPGDWRCKIEAGKGKVEVGKSIIPVRVKILSPYSPFPQGKPMDIMATFLKRDNTPVKENSAYRLWLGAKVLTPEPKEHFIKFKSDGKGTYRGDQTLETGLDGNYHISLTMKGGDQILFQQDIPIEVKPLPYLNIIRPKESERMALRSPVEIEAELIKAGQSLNPSKEFTDDPDSLIWVQLQDPKGLTLSRSLKQADKAGLFRAVFPKPEVSSPGTYILQFRLSGHSKTGERFEAMPEFTKLVKQEDWLDFLTYRWYWPLIGLLLLLFVLDWVRIGREDEWWLWRLGMPHLSGQISVQGPEGETSEYYLSGRRVDIGARGRIRISDPEIPRSCGYIVAVWGKSDEDLRIAVPKIVYFPYAGSKEREARYLAEGDSVTLADKYSLTYQG